MGKKASGKKASDPQLRKLSSDIANIMRLGDSASAEQKTKLQELKEKRHRYKQALNIANTSSSSNVFKRLQTSSSNVFVITQDLRIAWQSCKLRRFKIGTPCEVQKRAPANIRTQVGTPPGTPKALRIVLPCFFNKGRDTPRVKNDFRVF